METVRPFISDKGATNSDVILLENGKIENDKLSICNIFNDHFINVTDNFKEPSEASLNYSLADILKVYENHESIMRIRTRDLDTEVFEFNEVTEKDLETELKSLNVSKSCGYDDLPPKLIKLGASVFVLTHRLLLAKLSAYGLSNRFCELIQSYLYKRLQRVKIGNRRSEWLELKRGIPQGSVTGPFLFNVFLNDLFFALEGLCDDFYNYADDNTLGHSHVDINVVKYKLETASKSAIH